MTRNHGQIDSTLPTDTGHDESQPLCLAVESLTVSIRSRRRSGRSTCSRDPTAIIRGLSATITFENGFALIRGPNGIGKSLFGRAIAGHLEADKDLVANVSALTYWGVEAKTCCRASASKLRIDYIPQFIPSSGEMTANEIFWARSARTRYLSARYVAKKVATFLHINGLTTGEDDFNLLGILTQPLDQLSPLQRILVFVYDSLLSGRRLIIIDEPTAALSAQEAEAFYAHLTKLHNNLGPALNFLIISHPFQKAPVARKLYLFSSEEIRPHASGDRYSLHPPGERLRTHAQRPLVLHTSESERYVLHSGTICTILGAPGGEYARLPAIIYERILETRLFDTHEVRFLPARSSEFAVVGELPVVRNLVIDLWHRPEWAVAGPFVSMKRIQQYMSEIVELFDIRPASLSIPAYILSGGNKQKLLLARTLFGSPAVVIMSDPFAGLNPVSIQRMVGILQTRAASGTTFILFAFDAGAESQLANIILRFGNGRLTREE